LRAAPGSAALTVCAWDNASTGTPIPFPGFEWWLRSQARTSDGADDGQIRSYFQSDLPALSVLDPERNLALHCIRDASRVPYFEAAAPLRRILTSWMVRHGRALIHAGAVGKPDGGALLVGKGGSGKSTTSLACLHSDLFLAGDDYVLLGGGHRPFVHSLYHAAKLVPEQVWRVPHLEPWISNRDRLDREKAVVYLKEGFAEKLSAGFPLRAILLPRITGQRETGLVPAAPEESLDALVPSSAIQLPGLGREGVQMMVQTVQSLPSYVLELGTDLTRVPQVIASVLTQDRVSLERSGDFP
jgi:hypothetical protein